MTTNAVYMRILATMPPGLNHQVMSVLVNHIGGENRISRQALIERVTGIDFVSREDFRNSTEDRQVRKAIQRLQKAYPVLSDSGRGGYWLGDDEEKEAYISELESRRAHLGEKIDHLRGVGPLFGT